MSTTVCYIGLGSNLGDSQQILRHAVQALSEIGSVRCSKLYQSPPMGPQDQPDYLNAVVELTTALSPLELLDELQRIEQASGRVRLRHWGERTLDLDLLLYGAQEISHPRLTVPHVGLMLRDFVLLPLLDLNPNLELQQQTLAQLDVVKNSSLTVLADETWSTPSA